MDTYVYKALISCIKILEKKDIDFPEFGNQNKYHLHERDLEINKFNLVINRKGHCRDDTLTYIMNSTESGIMVRLDMTGPPHEDKNFNLLDTPHVHIFDEEHNNGKIVEPLDYITNENIKKELHDSLVAFLEYNSVILEGIQIPII